MNDFARYESLSVSDVIAAGRARAQRGGREVLLPGAMGIALIEELEIEAADQRSAKRVSKPSAKPATPGAVDNFTARIDAARERLKQTISPSDD
ncbi:MAG: hypothetical protein JHC87_07145 [Thermoleophilaceae bacterium]|nr:hypothetical protein [Thermoleophilaceae bacterium]